MEIRGNFEVFEAEARRLDDIADRVAERIRSESLQMDAFLSSTWTGASSQAFRAAFETWAQAASESVERLQQLVHAIRDTAHAQQVGEDEGARSSHALGDQVPSVSMRDLMGGA